MKQRITLKQWAYIGKSNHAVKWLRPFCSYTLSVEDAYTIKREQQVNLIAYILMFIPIHILLAFVLMWDGGLKEFKILKRYLGSDLLYYGSESYKKAEMFLNEQESNFTKNILVNKR